MTIKIRITPRGLTLRYTGADARRAFDKLAADIDGQYLTEGRKPLPNRSKTDRRGVGASQGLRASVARVSGGAL